VDDVYAAANVVTPSLIRVEADEVTYHLHVMVRFELERALLSGDLSVGDLPAAWNERYRAYLGITPPDDARGCLQDVHWSAGLLGYFPTYTLGTLLSVQLWEAMGRDLGDVDEAIRRGELGGVLEWMREHVHRHGRRYTSAELTERATGAPLSAEPYLRYVRRKYGDLYGLQVGRTGTAAT
jgi:carboxypeptidase Taq